MCIPVYIYPSVLLTADKLALFKSVVRCSCDFKHYTYNKPIQTCKNSVENLII